MAARALQVIDALQQIPKRFSTFAGLRAIPNGKRAADAALRPRPIRGDDLGTPRTGGAATRILYGWNVSAVRPAELSHTMSRRKCVHRRSELLLGPPGVSRVLSQKHEYSIGVEIGGAGILNHTKEVSLDGTLAIDGSMRIWSWHERRVDRHQHVLPHRAWRKSIRSQPPGSCTND